jgi:hypothetical protein
MAAAANWAQLCNLLQRLLHIAAGDSCSRTAAATMLALSSLQEHAGPRGYCIGLLLAEHHSQQLLELILQRHESCVSSSAGESSGSAGGGGS